MSEGTHIIVEFDRSSLVDHNGRVVMGPDPHGVSGGGVWWVGDYPIVTGAERPRLVGIATEWRAAEKVLVGVRISVVTSMIAEAYSDTRSVLPEPTHFEPRVNCIDS